MKLKYLTLVISTLTIISGCGSTDEVREKIPLDNDPRIGSKVNQVCFIRNIRSWSNVDNDRNGLIVKMNNKQQYKVKVVGACDPDLALMSMYIIPRGNSSCFSRGDKVKTDGDLSKSEFGAGCTILSINEWNPEAAVKQAEESTESSTSDES